MRSLYVLAMLVGALILKSDSRLYKAWPHRNHVVLGNLSSIVNSAHEKVGHKRVFGVIMAAFTVFNNIADFMGRCNNVVGWFDNINRFMGTGVFEGGSQITVEHLNKIKQQIEGLADQVNVMIWLSHGCHALLKLGLRDAVEDHFVALKGALILLLENICDPILNTYDLFEGYAWKSGEQGTGTLTDLMNFIARIRLLEANGYAVWKSHIYKKYEDNEYRQTVELNSVDNKMRNVAQCEDPAIARAFTRMIDHQGTPAYGRIRWSHTYSNDTYNDWGEREEDKYERCLTNLGSETTPYARACTDNHNQLWKLNSDNALRPKDDSSKCLFLIEPGNSDLSTGFKVLPCNSNYPNKKFNFEYLTQQMPSERMLHTFFKLKVKNDGFTYDDWQGQNLCLAYRPIGSYTGPAFQDWSPRPFACVCPSPPNVPWCIGDFVANFEYGWFKFEPVSE
ncbi:hypothetical protein AWC38_SpisGene6250 [Stylophora pistillata]|uniref:Uncharacterized protein n=1 Tax=Stylophora pistillata TaxID=50429 RepID=A0A2B4SHW7_STYPI|nr:hypothetical protein AWC38_SpisGene6250 [Stylophora pistillata]